MKELLSICIPTYNRANHLDSLLAKIEKQIDGLDENLVRIYVSDNKSEDHTKDVMAKYQSRLKNLTCNTNDENVGMMGNFLKLYKIAQGEFVWLFGDDDEFVNIDDIANVCNILKSNKFDMLVYVETECNKNQLQINEFVNYYTNKNPYSLLAHTWITANIIRRECFDIDFAESKLYTFYMHIYGIMRGLNKQSGVVHVLSKPFAKPCDVMGAREDNFPSLKDKWVDYYHFLSEEFAEPYLVKYAKRWKADPSWKKYFKIKNYINFFRKLSKKGK